MNLISQAIKFLELFKLNELLLKLRILGEKTIYIL